MDEPGRADHARVERVDEGRAAVTPGLVEGQALLQMLAALGQPPKVVQRGPDDAMPGYPRGGVAPLLRRMQQLLRGLVRRGEFGALEMDDEASVQGREELRDIAQLTA